jgi:hypothetical protein
MDQPLIAGEGAIVDRLLKRIERQVGAQRARHAPADDSSGEHVDDKRHVSEAAPGRDVGQARDPQLIGPRRRKLARDEIEWTQRRGVGVRGHLELPAPHDAPQAELAHQPRDGTAGDHAALSPKLLPYLADAVDLAILPPDPADVVTELGVTAHPCRTAVGIAPPGAPLVVHRRGNRQYRADRVGPVDVAVSVDEAHHHLARRSSSACAKHADAFLRISLARRSSKFSRSRCLRRSRSSVVSPGR